MIHQPVLWYRSVVLVLGRTGWLAEISADLREEVAHQRHVRNDALYKSTITFTLLSVHLFHACEEGTHAALQDVVG